MNEKPMFTRSCDYLLHSFTVTNTYISIAPQLLATSIVLASKMLFKIKSDKSTDQEERHLSTSMANLEVSYSEEEVIEVIGLLLINFIKKMSPESTAKYRQSCKMSNTNE